MKTTVDISGPLLNEAKVIAGRDRTTVKALVEEGLRHVLDERRRKRAFRLKSASFKGSGLHPDVREGTWERIRELAYEGRGA
jgi:hypothetical protein